MYFLTHCRGYVLSCHDAFRHVCVTKAMSLCYYINASTRNICLMMTDLYSNYLKLTLYIATEVKCF